MMKLKTAFLITSAFLAQANVADTPHLYLELASSDLLAITYTFDKPATRLAFKRNPDSSRISRWNLVSDDFQLYSENGNEYISKKDNGTFTLVEIEIPTSYTYLPADYAPFQPFSDGGLLLHSGRFFACSWECSESDSAWKLSAMPAGDSVVILNGEQHMKAVSWEDKNDGTNLYFGGNEAIETAHFIAVVDSGLPTTLRQSLETTFPIFMEYFEKKIGVLESKPMLFASYGRTGDGRSGKQGGFLPDQVFMHWYGDNLVELLKEDNFVEDTNWFFAHEAAHLYQQRSHQIYSTEHPWIHEGFAEIFAKEAMLAVSGDYADSTVNKAEETCLNGLSNSSLSEAAANISFELNYSCGLMIHSMVSQQLIAMSSSSDIFDVWATYYEAIVSGLNPGEQTYFDVVSVLTNESYAAGLLDLIH